MDQSRRGKRRQTIKGGAYVECFRKSDFLLSECGSALGPRRAVLRSASGLEEGVASCMGIHLARLCVSNLRLTLARRRTVCTAFSEKVRVFQAYRGKSRTRNREMRERGDTPRFAFRTRGLYFCFETDIKTDNSLA